MGKGASIFHSYELNFKINIKTYEIPVNLNQTHENITPDLL